MPNVGGWIEVYFAYYTRIHFLSLSPTFVAYFIRCVEMCTIMNILNQTWAENFEIELRESYMSVEVDLTSLLHPYRL